MAKTSDVMAQLYLMTLLVVMSWQRGVTAKNVTTDVIRVAAILPESERLVYAMMDVAPAIEIAVKEINEGQLLPGRTLKVSYRDSRCNIAHAINEAIKLYIDGGVNLFLGPCCDYAAAPVARQAAHWNIPMVTTGAMATDFGTNKQREYSLLTRVGPSFDSLVTCFLSLLRHFRWRKVKLIYEPEGHGNKVHRFCHLAMNGIHVGLRDQTEIKGLRQDNFKFEKMDEALEKLSSELGTEWGAHDKGKFAILTATQEDTYQGGNLNFNMLSLPYLLMLLVF